MRQSHNDKDTKARPIGIIMLKNRSVSPAAQLFIEHLRVTAKKLSAPALLIG